LALFARIKPWAQRSQNYFIIIGDWGKAGRSQPKMTLFFDHWWLLKPTVDHWWFNSWFLAWVMLGA
jgi:hypothetical protein